MSKSPIQHPVSTADFVEGHEVGLRVISLSETEEFEVGTSLEEGLSSLELANSNGDEDTQSSEGSEESLALGTFDPIQCLFCNDHNKDLDENLNHMQKKHGMFIPNRENLIVDLETLIKYFHLVIHEYSECLYCGSVRSTPQAAQQHMMGKGHCKIDIENEDSEFWDFYDVESSSDSDDDRLGDTRAASLANVDEGTRRLASGKLVSHRRARKPRDHRRLHPAEGYESRRALLEEGGEPTSQDIATALVVSGRKKDLVTAEKQENLFNKQLATMRLGDRQALKHLPLPQQRALVAKAKKQQEMWNRFESDQAIKRQCKGMVK